MYVYTTELPNVGLCTGHGGRMVPYQTVGHVQIGTGAGTVNTLVSGSGVQR